MSEAAAAASTASTAPLVVGRYALFDELAAGGMATVHLGRLLGTVGFGRTVAVKRLHSHYLKDQEFITMFLDEARIVARIRHPNVVSMVDVVQSDKGLFLVMEYIHGESLSRLMRTARQSKELISPKIVTAIMYGVLMGLHAAHETKGPDGKLLGVVHRDVSPQNVIVGSDGVPRVLDFGIAKAQGRAQVTREGQIKGKLAYMAPEQIRGQVDRRTDVFAAAVVLWEMLAGRRLHEGAKDVEIVTRVVQGKFPKPSLFNPDVSPELDAVVLKGLATDPELRYLSARDLAMDLEKRIGLATQSDVTEWVERLATDVLRARADLVAAMEVASADLVPEESSSRSPSLLAPPSDPAIEVPKNPLSPNTIPIEFEVQSPTEASTTSAVFAHTQTARPEGMPVTPTGGRKVGQGQLLAMVAFGVLAIVGLSLGAYAISQRSSARQDDPGGSPSARPQVPTGQINNTVSPPPTSPTPGEDRRLAPSATMPSASAAPTHSATSTTTATPSATSTTSTTSTTPTPPTTATAPPTTARPNVPTWTPPPRPAAKKCDPPYTLDESGHRHYKPECLE